MQSLVNILHSETRLQVPTDGIRYPLLSFLSALDVTFWFSVMPVLSYSFWHQILLSSCWLVGAVCCCSSCYWLATVSYWMLTHLCVVPNSYLRLNICKCWIVTGGSQLTTLSLLTTLIKLEIIYSLYVRRKIYIYFLFTSRYKIYILIFGDKRQRL